VDEALCDPLHLRVFAVKTTSKDANDSEPDVGFFFTTKAQWTLSKAKKIPRQLL
jgi:hypothetical protein